MEPFPENIARFIEANIDSVDQLEILRFLATDRAKEWTPAALARAMQTPPQTIAAHVDILERRGLLVTVRGPNLSCRYSARTPQLEGEVTDLLRHYNQRPVTMIRMIYDRG